MGGNRTVWGGTDPDMADLLTGIYGTTTAVPAHTVDAYVLYPSKSDVEFSTTYTDRPQQNAGNNGAPGDYFTFSSRWKSKGGAFGPWDWNGEFAIQVGDVVNPGHSGVMGAVGVRRLTLWLDREP